MRIFAPIKQRPIQCMGKLLVDSSGKTSQSGISIMDKIKINEQNKSIASTYAPNLKRSYLKV